MNPYSFETLSLHLNLFFSIYLTCADYMHFSLPVLYVDLLYREKKKNLFQKALKHLQKYKYLRKELTKNKLCPLIAFACAVYIVLAADPLI